VAMNIRAGGIVFANSTVDSLSADLKASSGSTFIVQVGSSIGTVTPVLAQEGAYAMGVFPTNGGFTSGQAGCGLVTDDTSPYYEDTTCRENAGSSQSTCYCAKSLGGQNTCMMSCPFAPSLLMPKDPQVAVGLLGSGGTWWGVNSTSATQAIISASSLSLSSGESDAWQPSSSWIIVQPTSSGSASSKLCSITDQLATTNFTASGFTMPALQARCQ
jgi:hypothetical protein